MAPSSIAQFLSQTPYCLIATIDGDKPRLRAFQFQFEQDGKLWFCTAKSKDIYKQLQANPQVEICAVKEDMSWIRLNGAVILQDDNTVKERILAEQPLIKDIYKTVDNPDFTTFYMEHGTVTIANLSGTPPQNDTF